MTIRANWWLRDVVSAANFSNINNNGNANYNGASISNGVRPDFSAFQVSRLICRMGKITERSHWPCES